jgi:hypothetical protein
MPALPKLTSIDLSNTPFARNQFSRVSLLILFGKNLRLIDGERISGTERQIAGAYPPGSDALVRAGWIATYPPPAPGDLPKITASLAGRSTNNRIASGGPRVSPVIARKAKPQSKVMDETLKSQAAEMEKLENEILKIQGRKTRTQRH